MKRRCAVWVLVLAHLVSVSARCHSQTHGRDGSTRDQSGTADLKERDELLAKAQASVKAAAAKVADDPTQPIYHVLAPANWINDPNGPIQHGGYYHLFYQHNPYGDAWGNMHWGHVRSRDLAHWEHMPIALWPSKSKGEEHCFSGCATVTKSGQLMLFYTSIGNRLPEQWAAVPVDDELIHWKKHAANPLLTEKLHGDTKVYEWRDPFVFHHGGRTYLVCGGNLNKSAGGQAVVLVYRAEKDALTEWKYLGELFRHPDAAVKNIECPLFFPLNDANGQTRFVLIVSPHGVEYFVGDLDGETMKFKPATRGIVDHGSFYAPNVMFDKQGRCLLWGWIRDFPGGKGWNGCLTVPRVLAIDAKGRLVQQPAEELKKLNGDEHGLSDTTDLSQRGASLFVSEAQAYRLICEVKLNKSEQFVITLPSVKEGDKSSTTIRYNGRDLDVAGRKAPLVLDSDEALSLDVLVDRSVLEVYANGRACVSRVIPLGPQSGMIEVSSRGGAAQLIRGDYLPMRTIWQNAATTTPLR
jgi:beta-fructofuranosidase